MVLGGTTQRTSSTYGKQELKHTAGSAARAVASSQSSRDPRSAMAEDTAEYSESL
jgi:hypothetical protein